VNAAYNERSLPETKYEERFCGTARCNKNVDIKFIAQNAFLEEPSSGTVWNNLHQVQSGITFSGTVWNNLHQVQSGITFIRYSLE
jgi:hypothetical protein